jgi:hypothetical protein
VAVFAKPAMLLCRTGSTFDGVIFVFETVFHSSVSALFTAYWFYLKMCICGCSVDGVGFVGLRAHPGCGA